MGVLVPLRGGSGPDQPRDRVGRLADLLVGLGAAGHGGGDDARTQVLLEQAERDRLQRLRHRRDLGEDVDAVLLVLDHALQAAGLALDPPEALEVVVLAVDVAVLVVVDGRLGAHAEELSPPRVYGARESSGPPPSRRTSARSCWTSARALA